MNKFIIKSWKNKLINLIPSLEDISINQSPKTLKYEFIIIWSIDNNKIYTRTLLQSLSNIDLNRLLGRITLHQKSYNSLSKNVMQNDFIAEQFRVKYHTIVQQKPNSYIYIFSLIVDDLLINNTKTPFDFYFDIMHTDIVELFNNTVNNNPNLSKHLNQSNDIYQ